MWPIAFAITPPDTIPPRIRGLEEPDLYNLLNLNKCILGHCNNRLHHCIESGIHILCNFLIVLTKLCIQQVNIVDNWPKLKPFFRWNTDDSDRFTHHLVPCWWGILRKCLSPKNASSHLCISRSWCTYTVGIVLYADVAFIVESSMFYTLISLLRCFNHVLSCQFLQFMFWYPSIEVPYY